MTRPLRYTPRDHMVEVTLRTMQGRLLLRPTRTATKIIAGVIGRAQRKEHMEIHAVVAMGNHVHLLISPRNAGHMARFMNQVSSNIARKVGKLVGWHEKFWGRRYRSIVVSNEEVAQARRLRYLLAHGVKEGFTSSPLDWPGLHSARPLLDGSMSIEGVWHDATSAYRDRKVGNRRPAENYQQRELIRLSPLPSWRHLSTVAYQRRIARMVATIEQDYEHQRGRDPSATPSASRILSIDPHERPTSMNRSPAPAFHAATDQAIVALQTAYRIFVSAYREASEKLRRGEWPVSFPSGCFPPALPFVPG